MRRELSIIFALALGQTVGGCTVAETACLTDTDCDQGQVCELEVCTASCTSNQECGDEEACVPRRDDDGRVCRIQLENGENAENAQPGATWVVLVRDETVDVETCDTDASPGADLTGVSLEDLLGTRSGVAEIVLSGTTGAANAHLSSTHLDGVVIADACGDERLSLGCGGWAALRFLDERGQPVVLDTLSSQVRIQERGETCGDDTDEPYALYVCSDANAVENNDDISSCTTLVGHGSGEQTFLLDAAVMMGG